MQCNVASISVQMMVDARESKYLTGYLDLHIFQVTKIHNESLRVTNLRDFCGSDIMLTNIDNIEEEECQCVLADVYVEDRRPPYHLFAACFCSLPH